MTINFGFVYGAPLELHMHNKYELFASIVINLIATVLKLGDKSQTGSVLLATSLVADLQLIIAATIWTIGAEGTTISNELFGIIISLAGGALLANITSVILYIADTVKSKR
jgi:hypothetical protein